MQGNDIPTRVSRVINRQVGGEVVAVHPDHATLHALNPTASTIWQWVDGRSSLTEIAQRLSRRYQVDDARAERDVMELMGELQALGLVELRSKRERD